MDVTPQLLREVEFRERLRGYHPDDVDDFLERVAIAVEGLLARLAAAEGGAPAAPEVAEPAAPEGAAADDELRRTLVLAQRTADAVVAEAREEAARILADAESTAARLRTEHAELQARVAQLHDWLDEAREAARSSLREVLERLEHPVTLPEPPEGSSAPPPDPGALHDAHDGDGEDPVAGWADEPTGEHPVVDLGDDHSSEGDAAPSEQPGEQPDPLADLSGPALQAGVADDPFFTELRRAVTDEGPLGPRDDGPGMLDHLAGHPDDDRDAVDRDDAELVSSRFRIRRRR